MENSPNEPSVVTERMWLAQGLQMGLIRKETAVKIMELLDKEHDPTPTTDPYGNYT